MDAPASPSPHRGLPHGSLVALLTPFTDEQRIDKPSFRRMIDLHIAEGTSGIVVAGTTGESATLSHAEYRDLLVTAVEHSAGRIHVMAGVGANSTAEGVELARFASDHGADSLLSVVPYYNKPTQKGLIAHFSAQADASDVPLVLYNVPGRTVIDMAVSSVAALARHPNIAGLKDATGDMARAAQTAEVVPPGFMLYSGDDLTTLPYLVLGGQGVISVLANLLPREVATLCNECRAGRWEDARARFFRMLPLTRALFVESSPAPLKLAASWQGLCTEQLRLPLYRVQDSTARQLKTAWLPWQGE